MALAQGVEEQLTPSSLLFLFLHPGQACRRLMSTPVVRSWHRAELLIPTCRTTVWLTALATG